MVGLSVGFGGFISFAEKQPGTDAAKLLEHLEAVAEEVSVRHGMAPVRSRRGGVLFVGESLDEAIAAAETFAEQWSSAEPEYLPLHVSVAPGESVELDDGRTAELSALVSATAHPADTRPAMRA